LRDWFRSQKRLLPWREEPTLYRVWVSEIMLQQTQVKTVIPYFERFVARFPNVEALAAAPEQEVLTAWAGLGYYSRARNLQKAAKSIVARGSFPRTRADWLELPGVGQYTAGAILSIALDEPEAILDANVERVVSRLRRVNRDAGDKAYQARLWEISREIIEKSHRARLRPSEINQALMELGASHCSVKAPNCGLCPLRGVCEVRARARSVGELEAYPPRKKPKQWVAVLETVDCWTDGAGRLIARVRAEGEWRAGLWDLPETEDSEWKKLLARLPPARELEAVESRHVVTRHKITRRTRVLLLENGAHPRSASEGPIRARDGQASTPSALPEGYRWVSVREPEVPVGSALRKTLSRLLERHPELAPAPGASRRAEAPAVASSG
jgi:A/G-specific adenine glycosylase